MPRIRSTKPEFWSSSQIASCSRDARLLFLGSWNFADDGGTHSAAVMRLKMEVFPGDSCDEKQVQGWIDELKEAQLIHEYEAQGKRWWWITGWHHQKVPRPCYKHPLPDIAEKTSTGSRLRDENSLLEHVPNSVESLLEHGARNDSTMLEHVPDHVADPADVDVDVDEKDASASCSESEKPTSEPPADFSPIVNHWNESGLPKIRKLTNSRKKKLKQRMSDSEFRDNWRKSIDRLKKSTFCMGGSNSGWKANFNWFIKPDTVLQIIEGQYDNSGKSGISKPGNAPACMPATPEQLDNWTPTGQPEETAP